MLPGGAFTQAIQGLEDGLRGFGLANGRHYVLHVRDEKGDLKAAAEAAKSLEEERVDLIFSVTTSISLAAKQATDKVPIVFYSGRDPVEAGLVTSFAKPGGRLTGVSSLAVDLVEKRLEILTEISPKLHHVLSFYDPTNPISRESAASARAAAQRLRVDLDQREVRSVEELRAVLHALNAEEGDAIFLGTDAMVISQAQSIVELAKARKLLTMFTERSSVVGGGLASYGMSYYAIGRQAAKHVYRVLLGTSPAELPVERFDRFELVVNARTAREIGVTLPPLVLLRADEVIQ